MRFECPCWVLATSLFFSFSVWHEKWTIWWGSGVKVGWGGERKVNKTHVYCSLSRYDSKKVWVSWDFNLLIKMMHLKTPFQSSFSWCLQTKKVFKEERLIFQNWSVENSAWRMEAFILSQELHKFMHNINVWWKCVH